MTLRSTNPLLTASLRAVLPRLRRNALACDHGSSLIELAIFLPVFTLLLLGIADFSRAYYLSIEVSRAAQSGALYGSQNPSDTTGIVSAAVADAQDVPGFTSASVGAIKGCECADGTGPSPHCTNTPVCSANTVDYVQVTTTATYQTLFPYPGIPSSFILNGSARMRATQ